MRFRSKKNRANPLRINRPADKPKEYSAVSIVPGRNCCKFVKEVEGERFLLAEAPRLPLADCMQPECQCRYRRHADRRREPRRAADVGLPEQIYSGPERRSGRDRRGSSDGAGEDVSYFDFFSH